MDLLTEANIVKQVLGDTSKEPQKHVIINLSAEEIEFDAACELTARVENHKRYGYGSNRKEFNIFVRGSYTEIHPNGDLDDFESVYAFIFHIRRLLNENAMVKVVGLKGETINLYSRIVKAVAKHDGRIFENIRQYDVYFPAAMQYRVVIIRKGITAGILHSDRMIAETQHLPNDYPIEI